MIAWLRAHADAFADALRRLAASPLSALLSLLAIGVALALPAGGFVILGNIQNLGSGLVRHHEISLFLASDARAADVAEIEKRLRAAAVGEFSFVAKDAALKRLQGSEGLGDLLAGLPRNPLPDAFILRPQDTAPEQLEAVARTISSWPKVAHVQLDSAWAKRLDAVLRLGRLVVAILAAVLGAGLVAVVVNTIRMQVLGRRNEVEVALLIGATPAFVARPFLWFGIVEGLLGGGLAVALVTAALAALAGPAGELLALYGSSAALRVLDAPTAAAVVIAGVLLGWVGGWISTRGLSGA